jgi:hypothetical protein
MFPAWVVDILKGMGLAGAIIFVLMGVIVVLGGVIRVMYLHANKVYGYRLAERDTLKDALANASHVLEAVLEATKDRNELTKELAKLIAEQSAAFELLKVTVMSEYASIREYNSVMTQAVATQAESLRQLTSLVTDHKNVGGVQVTDLKQSIIAAQQSIITALNMALGQSTIIRRGGTVPRKPRSS